MRQRLFAVGISLMIAAAGACGSSDGDHGESGGIGENDACGSFCGVLSGFDCGGSDSEAGCSSQCQTMRDHFKCTSEFDAMYRCRGQNGEPVCVDGEPSIGVAEGACDSLEGSFRSCEVPTGGAPSLCYLVVFAYCDKDCTGLTFSDCVAATNQGFQEDYGGTCDNAVSVGGSFNQCLVDLDSYQCEPTLPSSCSGVVQIAGGS